MSISGKEFKRQLLGDYAKREHIINDVVNELIKDNEKYPKMMVSTPELKTALFLEFLSLTQKIVDLQKQTIKNRL